jgi:predicted transcriptional regulator
MIFTAEARSILMSTFTIRLDDGLAAELTQLCRSQQRDRDTLLTDLVRKYVEAEKLRKALTDSSLAAEYANLADEDVALAEQGMDEYEKNLREATDV